MTRQRQLIYKIIMNTEGHLSADEIFGYAKAEMPSIALGTVYRNLRLMVEDQDADALDDYALSCFDLAWVDPQKVELNYLKDAFAVWQWLKEKLPFMPIYADRLADLEAMILQQEPAFNPRSVPIERIFLQTHPFTNLVHSKQRLISAGYMFIIIFNILIYLFKKTYNRIYISLA